MIRMMEKIGSKCVWIRWVRWINVDQDELKLAQSRMVNKDSK